jgi:hypothetical protein
MTRVEAQQELLFPKHFCFEINAYFYFLRFVNIQLNIIYNVFSKNILFGTFKTD